jgi:hypothetical protein
MLSIDQVVDVQNAIPSPATYTQAVIIEDQANPSNETLPSYNEVIQSLLKTEDDIEKPSLNEISMSPYYNNSDKLNIITSQPKSTQLNNLDDFKIKGILCGPKNISEFNLSDDYLSFSQKLCCYPLLSSSKNLCSVTNQLAIFDIEDQPKDTTIYSKKHKLAVKKLILSPDNSNFIVLYTDNDASKYDDELYLVTDKTPDSVEPLKNKKFNSEVKISNPLKKIDSIHYDGNQLYIIGKENNKKSLKVSYIDKTNTEESVVWKEITNFDNHFYGAKFSDNGSFLFLISNNNELSIFSKATNWSKIKTITNLNSFPIDIDYCSELMVFIVDGQLLIKGIKSDASFSIENKDTKFTTACFIPETKDLLAFSTNAKVLFLEYLVEDKSLYNITKEKKMDYVVNKAYFTKRNNKKLIALVNYEELTKFAWCAGCVGMCFGGPALFSLLGSPIFFSIYSSCFQVNPFIAANVIPAVIYGTSSFFVGLGLVVIGTIGICRDDINSITGKIINVEYKE